MVSYVSRQWFPAFVEVDIYGEKPVVWVSEEIGINDGRTFSGPKTTDQKNIRLYTMEENELKLKADWHQEVVANYVEYRSPPLNRQRIYFNPKTEKLYLSERNVFNGKGFNGILEIDPKNREKKVIELPFDAEDMAFDYFGNLYLRSINTVMRFYMDTLKEMPWDYGVEKTKVYTGSSEGMKEVESLSAINLPGNGHWHHGGGYRLVGEKCRYWL